MSGSNYYANSLFVHVVYADFYKSNANALLFPSDFDTENLANKAMIKETYSTEKTIIKQSA